MICLEVTNFVRKKKKKEPGIGEVVDSAATNYFQKKKDPELGLPADTSPAAEPSQVMTVPPTWMGDPTGNRRRLVIILIGLAVLGEVQRLSFSFFGRSDFRLNTIEWRSTAEAELSEVVRPTIGLRPMSAPSRRVRFAICLTAEPNSDLEVGKVYQILPDAKAAEVECLRVIDESGEDYLYPAKRFVIVDVPQASRGKLLRAVKMKSA